MNPFYEGFESNYFVTSDNVKLHYVVKGSGKTVIMIPGMCGSHASYCKLAPMLSEKYRVFVLDMRGHGLSETPAYGARIARLSKDVYEFWQFTGAEKATFIGHSMGNAVNWSMIDLFGQDFIENLIMIDESTTHCANPQDTEAQVREHAGARMDVWQIYNAYHTSIEEGTAALGRYMLMDQFPESMDTWLTLGQFTLPPMEGPFIGKLCVNHVMNDWRDLIPRIRVPALYVSGGKSYVYTPECSKWIVDHVPGCKYLLCPDGAHAGMVLQYASEINEAVCELVG